MSRIAKCLVGLITAIVLSYCVAIRASAVLYYFEPTTSLYTTSSGSARSNVIPMGFETKTLPCKLFLALNAPPKTSGSITVRYILENSTDGDTWLPIFNKNVTLDFNNTSSTVYEFCHEDSTYNIKFTKGNKYRVLYTVVKYTGSKSLLLTLHFEVNFN